MNNSTQSLLEDACRRGSRYWHEIADRSVVPTAEALAALAKFREALPEAGTSDAATLAMLDEIGAPATIGTAGSRFFGFVIGGAVPAALAANWLAAAWDQNSALAVMSPLSAVLEDIVIGWIAESLRFQPTEWGGGLVTGATMANFSGVAAARHALLARQGWNVEEDGMFGAPPVTVLVGGEVHSSMRKALGMVGFGTKRLVEVPVDGRGRMRPEAIGPIPPNSLICIQAGNVNTGAFDDADTICDLAHAAGAWVHVDGAFGMWVRVSSKFDELTRGFDKADSISLDAHKWLNVNYDSGIVLTRHTADLHAAFASGGAYLKIGEKREPMLFTPEQSRRTRAIDIWAAMKSMGRTGLVDLIERNCRQAKRFAEALSAAGLTVLNDVVINQVLLRYRDDETTKRLIEAIQRDGTCWCGGSAWQGMSVMRISVSSWRTTDADVEMSIDAIVRCAKSVA